MIEATNATSLSEAARLLISQRRRIPLTCARCAKPFVGLAYAKFCGRNCRQAAYNATVAEKLRAYHRQRRVRRRAARAAQTDAA